MAVAFPVEILGIWPEMGAFQRTRVWEVSLSMDHGVSATSQSQRCGDFCGDSPQTPFANFNKNQTTALILPCARGLEKSFCFCTFSLRFLGYELLNRLGQPPLHFGFQHGPPLFPAIHGAMLANCHPAEPFEIAKDRRSSALKARSI
jgi:hypothetical protein